MASQTESPIGLGVELNKIDQNRADVDANNLSKDLRSHVDLKEGSPVAAITFDVAHALFRE